MNKMYVYKNGELIELTANGVGKSAYESALDNGFLGTEKEWVDSLHGTGTAVTINSETLTWELDGVNTNIKAVGVDGNDGIDGKDGVTPVIKIDTETKHWIINDKDSGILAEGSNGADGKNGITPVIDINTKHWIVDGQDTGIMAEGANGVDGTNGVDGKDGVNGVDGKDAPIPSIDTNGNWFIGETDTGVPAKGVSIETIYKDESGNIVITLTDGTSKNIGQLSTDRQLRADTDYMSLRLGIDLGNVSDIVTKTKDYYDSELWDKERVRILVINGVLSSDDYETIIGETYNE